MKPAMSDLNRFRIKITASDPETRMENDLTLTESPLYKMVYAAFAEVITSFEEEEDEFVFLKREFLKHVRDFNISSTADIGSNPCNIYVVCQTEGYCDNEGVAQKIAKIIKLKMSIIIKKMNAEKNGDAVEIPNLSISVRQSIFSNSGLLDFEGFRDKGAFLKKVESLL